MHITVFGATSRVGRSVVAKLIEQNHTVTAFEDGSNPFISHPNIKIVQGDMRSEPDVTRALEGAEAVICAAGTLRMNAEANLAPAMRTILTEMERRSVWRIVVLSNVIVNLDGDHSSAIGQWVYKLYKTVMPKALRDSEDQIRFLQSSKADWTVIRAPNARIRGAKGAWKLSLDPIYPWQRVHADDVATALVSQFADRRYMNQAPFISTGKSK